LTPGSNGVVFGGCIEQQRVERRHNRRKEMAMTIIVELNDPRTDFLDLENARVRAAIESAKPEKRIRVLVKAEENRSEPSIGATGKLSADEKVFDVFVAGRLSHSWNWVWLQEKLSQYR
jgi:hypothetical protein